MNEVEKRLVESLDKVTQYIESTENFVTEQAPLVVQDIIKWGITERIYYMTVCFIISAIILSFGIYLYRCWKKLPGEDKYPTSGPHPFYVFSWVANSSSLILFLLGLLINGYELCYIVFAPRLYILDQIRHFLK